MILQVSTLGSTWQVHSRVRGQVPGWLEADWSTVASIVVVGWLCAGSRSCLGSVPRSSSRPVGLSHDYARLHGRERAEAWSLLRPRPSMSLPLCSLDQSNSVDQPLFKGWGHRHCLRMQGPAKSHCRGPGHGRGSLLLPNPALILVWVKQIRPCPLLGCLCHPLCPGGIAQ